MKLNASPLAVVALLLGLESTLQAGMTVYDLNDVYKLRIQDISFFAVLFIISAFGFKAAWNTLAGEFTRLPRLAFKHAFCAVFLGAIAMLLLLTMISGIREVLTPGAWRRQGSSYSLNSPNSDQERKRTIEMLRDALIHYARTHNGRFPQHDYVEEIPLHYWKSPDNAGTRYIYRGGLPHAIESSELLASEPATFGETVWVILASGELKSWPWTSVQETMRARTK